MKSDTISFPPGSQGYVPPPPPSPVSDATEPFAYLAANMPSPNDFIPECTQLIGNETSESIFPSLQCTAPETRPLLSLTPIPECDELSKRSSPMTTPEVVTPSSKQNLTLLCGPSVCLTNSETPLSPLVQQVTSSNSGGAMTHPSVPTHNSGFPTGTQTDRALISDKVDCSGPLSGRGTASVNFNVIARPWKKQDVKCTPSIISPKEPCEKKKVRFNIAPYEDRQNIYKELTCKSDYDLSVASEKNSRKDGVIAKDHDSFKRFGQISKLHDSSSHITPSPLSSSQVMNPLTAYERDTGPKVAIVASVTSTNNPENSHFVNETSDVEHDGIDWTHTTFESTINTEEKHAEVLDKRVANVPSEPQFRIATQTSEVTESQLVTDHSVASSSTLDYSTSSVASSGSQPDEYKVNMGK